MASATDQAQGLMIINGTSGAHDSNFESFIDSNQILDSTNSSTPPTPKGKANLREAQKNKLAPLSALPSRLHDAKQISTTQDLPHSPTVSDYLHFPRDTSSSSEVTTPTTASNSSSLHNLNFDFYEGNHSTSHGHDSVGGSNLTSNTDGGHMSAFGDSMQTTPTETSSSVPSASVFTWSASNAFFPIPMTHSLTRSSDEVDNGMASRHLSQNHQENQSHQRSLSLRDVAPPSASDGLFASSMTSLPFPSVKLEAQEADFSGAFTSENMPSPITEDRSSPASSSAICSSLFEMASPRQEKKRRLASPSDSITSTASSKNTKHSHNGIGSARKTSGGSTAAARRRKSSTSNGKGSTSITNATSSVLSNNSATADKQGSSARIDTSSEEAKNTVAAVSQARDCDTAKETAQTMIRDNSKEMRKNQEASIKANGTDQSINGQPKPSNKRPPPSASQITESGQPFPVIDTSAKHSSLFIPPDTSGLTKREARLVKNRAAAFLSRQRKREQFEELEIKCKSLCRLVWRFWEIVAGPNEELSFAEKFNQTKILPIVLEDELEDVKDVLEMVVALKGGSVAPTEDGQVQGAIAAGIKSANGKIIESVPMTANTKNASLASSSTSTINDIGEIARLKAELEESKKREASLQIELNKERNFRLGEDHHEKGYHEERGIRPFKGGKAGGAISLTIPPAFGEENEDETDHYRITSKKRLIRNRIPPARTSERILRQQSSNLALTTNSNAVNGGQRKAAGAALMMVLFSFALFGLPSGQTPRIGGITQVGSAEDFSMGKVLGAPLSTAQYGADEEEENGDFDMKQAPSSHLSAKDLLPSNSETSDLFNFDEMQSTISSPRLETMQQSFQEVLLSGSKDQNDFKGSDGIVDYRAFARDLGASLDWDVERGFLVIGSDHEHDNEIENEQVDTTLKRSSKSESGKDGSEEKVTTGEAPTKLTLFVPAPDVTSDLEGSEDRFYDAPLATADVTAGGSDAKENGIEGEGKKKSGSSTPKELTQAEATRAALRVLRNHRIAQEAAALATSRKLGKKSSPSQSIAASTKSTSDGQQQLFVSPAKSGTLNLDDGEEDEKMMGIEEEGKGQQKEEEEEEEEDYSGEVMNAGDESSTTDKIRGTDFYQLEFSLSGAKVRNVAELAKLFGVVRSKRESKMI